MTSLGPGKVSEETRMWQVLLISALLVVTCGFTFFVGGENEPPEPPEPGLPLQTYMMLTYAVEGLHDGEPVEGSFGVEMFTWDGGSSGTSPFNITGNISGLAQLPASVIGGGCYLGHTIIDTEWGVKEVLIYIDQRSHGAEMEGVCISYRGANTGLAYRVDLVAPEAKATYSLVNINITGMEELDLHARENVDTLLESRHLKGSYGMNLNGVGTSKLIEPFDGKDLKMSLTATNYTFTVFDEQDIWNMVGGGDFQYSEDWSLSGNGTVEFTVHDQMVFYYIFPNEPYSDPMGQLMIEVEA